MSVSEKFYVNSKYKRLKNSRYSGFAKSDNPIESKAGNPSHVCLKLGSSKLQVHALLVETADLELLFRRPQGTAELELKNCAF